MAKYLFTSAILLVAITNLAEILAVDESQDLDPNKYKTHLWARLSHDHSTRQKRDVNFLVRQLLEFSEELPPLFQDVSTQFSSIIAYRSCH